MIHNSAPGRNYEYCLDQPCELGIIVTLPGVTCVTNKLDKQVREIKKHDTYRAMKDISFKQTLFCSASQLTFFTRSIFKYKHKGMNAVTYMTLTLLTIQSHT
jgi:hypothetical protein